MITIRRDGERPRRNRGCMWTIIVCAALYIGMCWIFGAMFSSMFSTSEAKLKENTIYRLDMKGNVVEQAKESSPFASLMNAAPYGQQEETVGLDEILSNIKLAKKDDRVAGIYLRGGELGVAPANAKVIRDALLDFKESGKWVIAYADGYSQINYYIATAADKIYLNPVGSVSWHGLGGNMAYYKRLLDKIGVEMQVIKVGTFKSAVEPYIRTSMSEADRKQTQIYLDGIWKEVLGAVSQSRNISVDKLNAYADEFMDAQKQEKYLQYGLVDSLVYIQSMDTIIKGLIGKEDYQVLSHAKMSTVKRDTKKSDNKIAVVYAEGEITDNKGNGIVGTEMVKTLGKVLNDKNVKAMVFRVNSPGGSANASEQIWHAVKLIQKAGKPVVVSMGDYAASGGYYISCEAEYIFAEPTTLTGSIGIFGLIPNVSKLRDKVGYDIDGIGTNKHAAMQSNMMMRGMDASERAIMQSHIDNFYDLFTSRCAEGRARSQEYIKSIGEGRVWLGCDAVELDLVDELGNIDDAIAKAADIAGLEEYELAYYPEKKDSMEELMKMFDNSSDEEKLIAKFRELVKQPRILMLAPVIEIK